MSTPAQLDFIRDHGGYRAGSPNLLDDHYVLSADLDFSGYEYADEKGWQPIGHDLVIANFFTAPEFIGTTFTGSFNGRGYVIRNLMINRPTQDYVGLFGRVGDAFKIDSLGLEAMEVIGDQRVGGLVGEIRNGDVANCYAEGNVEGTSEVGGLIGGVSTSIGGGMISHSYATGQVTARDNRAGGLVGEIGAVNYILQYSYAASQVTGNQDVGGLVGWSSADTIYNCYALGQATGTADVGGLVGEAQDATLLSNNYAVVSVEGDEGGLLGKVSSSPNRVANYWNTIISGQTTSAGAAAGEIEGLITSDMYEQGSFSGWDFTNIWDSPTDGEHFPHLQGVAKNGQLLVVPSLDPAVVGSPAFTLDHTLLPPTLSGASPVYASSNESVATVSASGEVTIQGLGATTLSVRRAGNDDYASVFVSQPLLVHPFTEGEGTESDPYQVSTPAQLDFIRNHGGGIFNLLDDHYVLTVDLDFAGYAYEDAAKGWQPIGHDTNSDNTVHDGTSFTGSFNGQGYVLRNLFIDREDEDYVGLFGCVRGSATVDSLGMEALDITGRNNVGGLAGQVGGTVRYNYAVGQVNGEACVGGLVGYTSGSGVLQHMYAVVSVSGTEDVGGLLGTNEGAVDTCYAAGAVTGTTNVGGLLGIHSGTVAASYWNTETSGQATSAGEASGMLEGLTTMAMGT